MDYVFSVRNVTDGAFGTRVGASSWLEVPERAEVPTPEHRIARSAWLKRVQTAPDGAETAGDLVVYVHGYNTGQKRMMERLRKLRRGLAQHGFAGRVIAFDWPSANVALSYLPDRRDARAASTRLVDELISAFAKRQRPDCALNVHVLAHSMGAYVLREAFDDADDRPAVAGNSWSVSQVMLVAADVSSASLGLGNAKSSSLYRHCVRLTNYFSPLDEALSLSNIKRIGVAPRAGRVGLPAARPDKAVDVYCGSYYRTHRARLDAAGGGSHSWYFDDPGFMEDVALTVAGALDRAEFPTRAPTDRGNLGLRP